MSYLLKHLLFQILRVFNPESWIIHVLGTQQFKLNLRLAILIGCCFAHSGFAQSQYRFQHYSTEDGLASEYSFSVAQDSLGFIWVQYYGGLSRFDGYNFKVYRYDPNDSLRSNLKFIIGSVFYDDPKGNIWIEPHKGDVSLGENFTWTKHDRKTDGFVRYTFDFKSEDVLWRCFEKDGSTVWFGTTHGLYSYDLKTLTSKSYQNPNSDSVIAAKRNFIRAVSNQDSFLLLSSQQGLWLFDKQSEKFSRPTINNQDSTTLYQSNISILTNQDFTNDVWLLYNRGLTKIDSKFNTVHRFEFPKDFYRNYIRLDKEGNIWFTTDHGLYRYNPVDSSFVNLKHLHDDAQSIERNDLLDINLDRDRNIWLTGASGVTRLRNPDIRFKNFKFPEGGIGANAIYRTKSNEYLVLSKFSERTVIGRFHDILMFRITQGNIDSLILSHKLMPVGGAAITKILQGKDNLWVSGAAGGNKGITGFSINPQTELPIPASHLAMGNQPDNLNTLTSNNVSALWEDTNNNLWIGSDSGITKINLKLPYGTENSVFQYALSKTDSNSRDNTFTYGFYPEDEKSTWVLGNNGLEIFRNNEFERVFTPQDVSLNSFFKASDGTLFLGGLGGLYEGKEVDGKYIFNPVPIWNESEVTAIQEDNQGRMWLYGTMNLVCYDRESKSSIKFNKHDGIEHLGAIEVGWMHKLTDGTMIVVDTEGVTRFDPSSLQISNAKVNPVLTNLWVNNKTPHVNTTGTNEGEYSIPGDISVLRDLVLDYWHNNFKLEFSAMEMISPEKNLYKHKLEGYDKDWIETDYKNRTATYTNLPSGAYTFKVKASNHHGIWSDNERTLKVIILPPPWRTWWAYSGYSMLVVGLLVWARKNIVQRERLKASLQLEQVEHEKEHFELEKAKEVDKVKSSFFTNISHEFRTPLTLIKGPVQNILDQFINGQKEFDRNKIIDQLKLVQRNSDLLLKLINQLLDLAKLESGSLKVEKTEGDLFSFVRAIASSFHSFGALKNLDINISAPTENAVVLFDKDKVEAVLINLINNAIKFTPAGGSVIVRVYLTPQPPLPKRGGATHEASDEFQSRVTLSSGEGRGEVTISVKDTGIGIPPEHQSKIFERFHQVSEAHKEVGTGIGLAFVKQLVELMGGTISVSSEVGKGSEFVVLLPFEMATGLEPQATGVESLNNEVETPIINSSAKSLKPAANSPENEGGAKPHILVVEDNTDLRHFIIDSLGNEFNFLEAENGKQGLEIASREIPDLIISDVMMPEMDGITMTGKIKKDIRTSHIPIIILTAKSSEDSKLSGLSSGADDYLTKPFNKNELLLKVRNGVSRQVKLREKLRAELMSTAPPVHVLSEDEKFLNSVKEKILDRLSDEQLSVESLAEDIGMSRVQLYRKVSGLTDISVNELIRKLRLQRAAQLLSQNWGPVSQVAYEVGFSNLSYFSKVFKEEFGVLPSEYEAKSI